MIKIKRSSCPDVLDGSPSGGEKYKNKKIVKVLWKMQHGKCCYCEQKIPKDGHQKAVEHFKPKSIFKYLINDWGNLLLACPQCNGKKSDKFPVELTDESEETKFVYLKTESNSKSLIINPSDPEIDPEKHIDFIVDDTDDNYGVITVKNNSTLGRLTIDVIDLSNNFYTSKRRTVYCNILMPYYLILLTAKAQDNEIMIQTYKDNFKMLMSAKGEFAAFVRAYARYKQLDRRFGITITVGVET